MRDVFFGKISLCGYICNVSINEMKKRNEPKRNYGSKSGKKETQVNLDSISQLKNDIIISSIIDPFHEIYDLYLSEMKVISGKKNKSKNSGRKNEKK